MHLTDRVVQSVLHDLVLGGRLVLNEGADEAALVAAVLERFRTAPASAQLGPYFVQALLKSPLVDELFADNEEILELFNRPIE